jgi:hypothetical protein
MRFHFWQPWACLSLVAFSFTSLASASSTVDFKDSVSVESPAWHLEGEAAGLLKEVQSLSGKLKTEADTLESFPRQPQLSWQTHAAHLSQAREQINAIGERLGWLRTIQSGTAPWQQRAIQEVIPVAATIATHLRSAIEHLNDNPGHRFAPVYTDHLALLSERSGALKERMDLFLEFGDTSDQLDRWQQKLDQLQEKIGLLAS